MVGIVFPLPKEISRLNIEQVLDGWKQFVKRHAGVKRAELLISLARSKEESVMMLNPDLILVIGEDYVEKLSKIAPTVFIPYGDMTQDERITFIGEVLLNYYTDIYSATAQINYVTEALLRASE
ncbi:hypothetical protein ACP8HI_14885 [Paenibacillus sp. FA6]|uniref:hypothetical protein n=1 Tax=Paenibacillus sp. FA6 TaxID=3413029 RepID=UPI003F65DF25